MSISIRPFGRSWSGQDSSPIGWEDSTVHLQGNVADLTYEEWDKAFAVMALCPQIRFTVVTEQAGVMFSYLTELRKEGMSKGYVSDMFGRPARFFPEHFASLPLNNSETMPWPLPNVWLAVKIHDQATADSAIPILHKTPAAKRIAFVTDLTEPIDLLSVEYLTAIAKPGWQGDRRYPFPGLEDEHRTKLLHLLDWVVCAGSRDSDSPPIHTEWVRSLRDQCVETRVPFHFIEWGKYAPAFIYPRWSDYRDYVADNSRSLGALAANLAVLLNADGSLVDSGGPMRKIYPIAHLRRLHDNDKEWLIEGREWRQSPE